MLRRLGGWILFSPTRLGVTAFICLALMAAVLLIAHHSTTGTPNARPTAVASASRKPSRSAVAIAAATAASEPRSRTVVARVTAERFLRLYLRRSDKVPGHVPAALRRFSTPALWTGLRLADPASLPAGPLRELQTVTGGAYASEFTAELTGERALTVDVVAWSRGWRVSDVHPKAGS